MIDHLRLLLLICSGALVLILVRAIFTGNIHSNYAVTYRNENPGTFWALWIVLVLPLLVVVAVVLKLNPGPPN